MADTKERYYIDLEGAAVALVLAQDTAIDAGLATALGWTKGTTAEIPQGKIVAARGRPAAILAGAVPVVITYVMNPATGQTRTAQLLCAPSKVASFLQTTGTTATYRQKNIIAVRSPRRRIYR
jgi:hypothetical protein